MIKLELILEFCFNLNKLVNHLFNKLWKLLILIVSIMNRINNINIQIRRCKSFYKIVFQIWFNRKFDFQESLLGRG
jgi:hypothetical protein